MQSNFKKPIGSRFSGFRMWWILGLFVVGMVGTATAGLWDSERKTVVLDPGHGGQDAGIHGPGTSLEKDVTLTFARMMETQLGKAYRVVMTRTDDYVIEISKRTAIANHEMAGLFISIHAAESLNPENCGVELFCCDASVSPQTAITPPSAGTEDSAKAPRHWDTLQIGHQTKSEAFAETLKESIGHKFGLPVRIHQVPIQVLKGADMPAILMEIGYLTNPRDEMRFQNPSELAAFANAVCDAVFDYLK